MIEELYSRHDPSKYEQVYNHVHNLFFQSSIKKYGSLLEEQQIFIGGLIDNVASCLDGRIIHQYIRLEMDEPGAFQIRENIINHDYLLILAVLASLKFTPKDSKQFEMRKVCPVAPESPVYRHFKTTGFKSVEMQEELELATWMSVGGRYEWGAQLSKEPKASLSSRLQNIKGMDAGIRSGLSSESA